MIRYENDCVDCASELGCTPSICPYRNAPHLYCDCCGEEVDEVYDVDGDHLCEECLLEHFEKITV